MAQWLSFWFAFNTNLKSRSLKKGTPQMNLRTIPGRWANKTQRATKQKGGSVPFSYLTEGAQKRFPRGALERMASGVPFCRAGL